MASRKCIGEGCEFVGEMTTKEGLCRKCYNKQRCKMRPPAPCHPKRYLVARGMCGSCYNKWLKKKNHRFADSQRDSSRRWRKVNPEKQAACDRNWKQKQDKTFLTDM